MRAPGRNLGPLPVLFHKSMILRLARPPRRTQMGEHQFSRIEHVWLVGGEVEAIAIALGTGFRKSRSFGFVVCSWSSHLAGRDDLQRSQGNLEVGSVGLEVVESLSNVLLELGGVLPRRAVGGDLVQGLGAHFVGGAQRVVEDGCWRGSMKFWQCAIGIKEGSLNWGFKPSVLCVGQCANQGFSSCCSNWSVLTAVH